MLKHLIFFITFATISYSQETYDSECRIQAKEAAINTYQSCVKEARTQKIDEIRKEYQGKLAELKSYYDNELKKISPSKVSGDIQPNISEETSPTINLKKKQKAGKKAGSQTATTNKHLPPKKNSAVTLPVQQNSIQEPVNMDKEVTTFTTTPEAPIYETEL